MDERDQSSAAAAVRGFKDRRKATRYPITATAKFERKDASGQWQEVSGTTRDVGRAGLFMETETIPPVAVHLQFRVVLPAQQAGAMTLRLAGVGRVRHQQRRPRSGSGFGASVVWRLNAPESEKQRR
ncbi:MAG: hypothetical protein WBS19_18225 [Candidatus Korobacteraceae bacterium]